MAGESVQSIDTYLPQEDGSGKKSELKSKPLTPAEVERLEFQSAKDLVTWSKFPADDKEETSEVDQYVGDRLDGKTKEWAASLIQEKSKEIRENLRKDPTGM